jgi:hypothetical protein
MLRTRSPTNSTDLRAFDKLSQDLKIARDDKRQWSVGQPITQIGAPRRIARPWHNWPTAILDRAYGRPARIVQTDTSKATPVVLHVWSFQQIERVVGASDAPITPIGWT